jgi:hypothetical protein
VWTYAQWIARLNHEATNAKPSRLIKTVNEAEQFLEDMWGDPDWDGWITTYYAYMNALRLTR